MYISFLLFCIFNLFFCTPKKIKPTISTPSEITKNKVVSYTYYFYIFSIPLYPDLLLSSPRKFLVLF